MRGGWTCSPFQTTAIVMRRLHALGFRGHARDFRRARASCIAQSQGIEAAMNVLHHTSVDVTMRYLHIPSREWTGPRLSLSVPPLDLGTVPHAACGPNSSPGFTIPRLPPFGPMVF